MVHLRTSASLSAFAFSEIEQVMETPCKAMALRLIRPHAVPKTIPGCTSRRLDTDRRTSRGVGPPGPRSCHCPEEQCRTRRSPRRGCRRSPCCSASWRALQKEGVDVEDVFKDLQNKASMLIMTCLKISVQRYGLEAAEMWG